MTAVKQEVLARTGLREAYLRGEVSQVEAKRKLREDAIRLGVVKPVRQRRPKPAPVTDRRTRLDAMIALHLGNVVQSVGIQPNWRTIDREIEYLDPPEERMTTWGYGQIKYAGREGSEYERFDSTGRKHNPFWYH